MENKILLDGKNISKKYGKLTVLDGISLKLKKGEITCVLGASGCGKTTLLKILSGLEKPDTGTIQSDISLPGKSVGYMSQGDSLLPWKTVFQNVSFAQELIGKNDKKQIIKTLQQVHLSRFHHYYPQELSGGQKQRVNLARVLALSPEILFLDEPLSALDIVVKNDLADIIRQYVSTRQATALMITHSVEEALILADKIIILSPLPAHIYAEINVKEEKRDELYSKVKQTLQKAIKESQNA